MADKRIILTGGGSAGHVTPNLALIPLLQQAGWEVHYIGTHQGIERGLVQAVPGVTYHPIHAGKLRRYFDLKNVTDIFRTVAGVGQAMGIIRKVKPSVLFSKGGFVSVPVLAGAWMQHVPTVSHESDMTPGLATRLSMRFAGTVCVTFPETLGHTGAKGKLTGTPLRQSLYQGDAQRGREVCGFTRPLPTLLTMGGSLGAVALNDSLRAALDALLSRFNIIHLCGKGNLDASLAGREGYCQLEYANDTMADLLAAADLVVTRAGANSLVELQALGKPMLLIPLPLSASRGDQLQNAASYKKRGLAHVLEQEQLTADSLRTAVFDLYDSRAQLKAAIASAQGADGTQAVLEVILAASRKEQP